MVILGIDTSCDDTSFALLKNGKELLANLVSSQIDLHKAFGGVVPEIASRKHVVLIDGLYKKRRCIMQVSLTGQSKRLG